MSNTPLTSPPAPPAPPSRPDLDERRQYAARGRQEEFIVPLLRGAIEQAVASAAETALHQAKPQRRALDVGCGGQPFRTLIESAGFTYHSIDTQAQPGITLTAICAIDEPLPDRVLQLTSAGFDLVLCTEVLEHVLDWPAAWANLHRLLAPGGRLIITCPFVYPLHEEPYDFWRATPHALRRFAERFDFIVIKQQMLGDGFDALGTVNAASTPDPAFRGVSSRLLATFARKGRKFLHRLLSSPRIRGSLSSRSKLYVANFIVLSRADHAGGSAP